MKKRVLFTHASSAANEYTPLDRPTVCLDAPELLKISQTSGAAL
jgi:hypothetical protein